MSVKRTIKAVKIQQGDIVACYWLDHVGYKSIPLVPGTLRLVELVTYGEVLSVSAENEVLELIQERHLTDGGDANDGCAIGLGMTKKIVVYRPVCEIDDISAIVHEKQKHTYGVAPESRKKVSTRRTRRRKK